MNIIVKMKFGSHLYGTDSEDSDLDYKGVFLPSKGEILLGRIPKSYSNSTKKGNEERNTSDDIDTEIYSLHFKKLEQSPLHNAYSEGTLMEYMLK